VFRRSALLSASKSFMLSRFLPIGLLVVVLLAFSAPSFANSIISASGTVTCSGYVLDFSFNDIQEGTPYTVNWSFQLQPSSGPTLTITGSQTYTNGFVTSTPTNTFSLSLTSPFPLTQVYSIVPGSATATLVYFSVTHNSVPITFTSPTVTCGSLGGGACPATIGYWKHHAFPSSVQTSGLTIGVVTYTPSELLDILNSNGGNAAVILGRQLVGALLNEAAGGKDNSTADAAILTSEALLTTNNVNLLTSHVDPSSSLGQALLAQESILDKYNSADFNTCSEGSGLT
jgi:hypothetical protein